MKQIDKFIDKYGSMFDPLAFQFDGVTYITHKNKDGTISYHQIISSTDKEAQAIHAYTDSKQGGLNDE